MSEEQNIAAVTKIYEAFGKGDIPYIIDQLTDDVRWFSHVDAVAPTSGDWSGKAKVPGFFQAIVATGEVTAFVPTEFVAQGDTVVSTGDFGFVAAKTGKSVNSKWIFIWKFRGGKVCSYEQFHDGALANAFR
ncbi:MAG: nuclear transport factor 2 family protein [Actinomycetia bacterium]|nr:nuclear transport factor 2 family protein [Actinomycetes bacterium]